MATATSWGRWPIALPSVGSARRPWPTRLVRAGARGGSSSCGPLVTTPRQRDPTGARESAGLAARRGLCRLPRGRGGATMSLWAPGLWAAAALTLFASGYLFGVRRDRQGSRGAASSAGRAGAGRRQPADQATSWPSVSNSSCKQSLEALLEPLRAPGTEKRRSGPRDAQT